MKKFQPAPERAIAAFRAAAAHLENVEPRKMFGYDCAFVNGNMFFGVHEVGLFLRLPESTRNEFKARYAAKAFEPMPGRPMNEYMSIPDRLLDAPGELRQWIGRSLSYARTLPPRVREEKKAPAPDARAGDRRRGDRPAPARPRPQRTRTPASTPTVIIKKRRTIET